MLSLFRLCFLFSILLSCRPNAAHQDIADVSDTITQAEMDTPQENTPVVFTPSNRVAWQKPQIILDLMGQDLKNKVSADIGAGPTGFFTFLLARQGAQVLAIDIDPSALAYIEKEKLKLDSSEIPLIKTRLAKPEDPNLKNGEIDGILIVNTIAYIQNKSRYLQTLRNKLRDGGHLIIVDFKMKRLPEQIAPAKNERVYYDVLEELLYEAGYQNIKVDEQTLDYQYILIADK